MDAVAQQALITGTAPAGLNRLLPALQAMPDLLPPLLVFLLIALLLDLHRRLRQDPSLRRWPWGLGVVLAVVPGVLALSRPAAAWDEALLLGALSAALLVALWLGSTVADLRQTRARLRQANAELEARVRERTRALETARDLAEAASSAKSRFLATMTHELRTPLNAVLGATELLAERPQLHGTDRRLLESAHDSGRHLLAMIENVLDLSRIEAGQMPVVPAPFSLAECVHGALEAVRLAAERKGLLLELQGGGSLTDWRLGDALLIKRVLINLLGNAVKFTARGSVILSLAEDAPGSLRIEVRDTGIGIPAAALQRIFEPFRQADDTTTRRHGGSGLGLAITRELLTALGGSIELDSVEGLGTTMTVRLPLPACEDVRPSELAAWRDRLAELRPPEPADTLPPELLDTALAGREPASLPPEPPRPPRPELRPLAAADPQPAPALESAAGPAATADALAAPTPGAAPASPATEALTPPAAAWARRLLVVEDDMVNQLIATQMLAADGWQVDIAEHGGEALARLRERPYALVLMDWQMPVMDGLEATRRLRAGESGIAVAALPVIGVTANAHADDRQACLAAGMNEVVTKPLSLPVLRAVVRQWAQVPASA
ncbi:response regulator [Piscinibacter sp. Jin2]|uniref:Virulence sensor protein BvgS n=1 Tax=Aquariibacter lacus TaxID=2801332 RepID=A0A9X0XDZ2_9BURK|nr:response regulator [Piscinibacter lacus]